jgi:hypothetical protein
MSRDQWNAALPSEVHFWKQIIDGTYPNPEWVADMRLRASGRCPFPRSLGAYLSDRSVTVPRSNAKSAATC